MCIWKRSLKAMSCDVLSAAEVSDVEAASTRITTGETGGVCHERDIKPEGLDKSNSKLFTSGKTMANR